MLDVENFFNAKNSSFCAFRVVGGKDVNKLINPNWAGGGWIIALFPEGYFSMKKGVWRCQISWLFLIHYVGCVGFSQPPRTQVTSRSPALLGLKIILKSFFIHYGQSIVLLAIVSWLLSNFGFWSTKPKQTNQIPSPSPTPGADEVDPSSSILVKGPRELISNMWNFLLTKYLMIQIFIMLDITKQW